MAYVKRRAEEVPLAAEKSYGFITHPEQWHTNLCTLIRRNKDAPLGWDMGILRRDEYMKDSWYGINVYRINSYLIRGTTDWSRVKKDSYTSVVELLKDGWRLD